MALIQCKECKNEISTKAEKCPYCGAFRYSVISRILLLLMIACILGTVVFYPKKVIGFFLWIFQQFLINF